MSRKLYEPTAKQIEKWALADSKAAAMPTDDEFKLQWAKEHHGKEKGWGMAKKNWILRQMSNTTEYQTGIWQGRVDCATGFGYAEKKTDTAYNLGYYRGYTEYVKQATKGWDKVQAAEFKSKYMEA